MSLIARIEALTRAKVAQVRALHGGDLSEVAHVTLADGREYACKTGPLVSVEARMLDAIGATAPAPRFVEGDLLLMDYLPGEPATPTHWRDLGRALRALHDRTGDAFGWPEPYAFGAVAIPNDPAPNWPIFWAECRLRPSLSFLPPDLAGRIETLIATLPDRLPKVRPALLHGDLWTGNVHFSHGRAWLIDPACYYGHGEVDLAMLHLFGSPPAAFRDGYGVVEPGYGERQPIYQLWPALVHYRLFGSGYAGMLDRLLSAAGV
ncbi:fructosamine kinase family protein [Thalassovita mangrovi]|uniref:Phosphotransferase n=1 Tax=Thalassovita mangrovi TaxID=2692236 RepID=A0A6L8LNU6_9RHOB|nr:fructosamine kinase family protein [Thalassovita mangrovi]MYM54809.1 phosphotransferase [Thalassovita mangrovi]